MLSELHRRVPHVHQPHIRDVHTSCAAKADGTDSPSTLRASNARDAACRIVHGARKITGAPSEKATAVARVDVGLEV